jgi:hypothetical protein
VERNKALEAQPADELDALVIALLHEKPWAHPGAFYGVKLDQTKTGPKLLALDKPGQAEALHRFLEHRSNYGVELDRMRSQCEKPQMLLQDPAWLDVSSSRALADLAIGSLLGRKLPLTDATLRATVRLILEAPQLHVTSKS